MYLIYDLYYIQFEIVFFLIINITWTIKNLEDY